MSNRPVAVCIGFAFASLLFACAPPRSALDTRHDLGASDALAPAVDQLAAPSDLAAAPATCFPFSNDPDDPLAIDGVFDKTTPRWQRPYDDEPVCPATALLPDSAEPVPYVMYAFCNPDTVAHHYRIEWLANDGAGSALPLDDPFLVVYPGDAIAHDARQCSAINDDIPETLNTGDAELEVTVAAGAAIAVVGTAFTFSPTDSTGQGAYILVVTNID